MLKTLVRLFNIKTSYRIQTVKVGVKERFRIQMCALGFVVETVNNPLVVSPVSPYEFKIRSQAETKMNQLSKG